MNNDESAVRALYTNLIGGWNNHDADEYAAGLAENTTLIGFDGSLMQGKAEVHSTIAAIFRDHQTTPYTTKIQGVRFITPDVAILSAISGMIPVGQTALNPKLNTRQTLVAVRTAHGWQIASFQNTPAQLHGRPELVEQMTAELRELL